MSYVKKPIVVEAFRYGIDPRPDWFDSKVTANEIITHCGTDRKETQNYYCEIKTLEGVMTGKLGDYIIQGVKGECYPCKPDIFEKTYAEHKPKRQPLADGTLPLTESEYKEFSRFYVAVQSISIRGNIIVMNYNGYFIVDNYKAILYLADRFDLTGGIK